MASIPLPALHLNPIAPPPSPMAMYGQMMGIKSAQQEMQQRQALAPLVQQQAQQQVQSGALSLEKQQRGLNDEKAMDATMQQWFQGAQGAGASASQPAASGTPAAQGAGAATAMPAQAAGTAPAQGMQTRSQPNYDDLLPIAAKNKLSSEGLKGLQTYVLSMKGKASTIAKDDAQTGASTAATIKANNGMIGDAMTGVMSLPDAQLPQGILSAAQELYGKGVIDPNHMQQAQQLAHLAQSDPAQARQQLNIQNLSMGAFSKELDAQEKQAAHGPLSPGQVSQLNQGFAQRWNVLNPNGPVPGAFQLAPGATADDFTRADKLMQGTETARQTQATQAATQGYRTAQLGFQAQRLNLQQQQLGVGTNGQPSELAQNIASGHITPDRLSYIIARNPGILDQVGKIDPSFDASKAQSYPAAYKDFTSGKTSVALNSGGTALTHLNELNNMNTVASHIPTSPDYNAYQNKADTVASELAKFYGDATIPAIDAIKRTLTAQLPGNRQAAIRTQAQSMGDKLDSYQQQWENAAPSKSYEAPMPGISPQAMQARAALDPNFAASQRQGSAAHGAAQPQAGQAGSGGAGAPPAGATHIVLGPDGKNHYTNNQGTVDLGVAP